ncbi:PQQ-binding-like beta-propeller repeat protein [Myxococcus faecalis]|uniref:outer membrane protein assembly factor BamB family protein n=1 Tax=Myxococcus faecalis TaxID=3115646 RepID=UPI0038D01DD7
MNDTSPAPGSLLITAFNGLVAAYERASGDTVWTFALPGKSVPGVRPRPTYAELREGRVFVFSGGAEGTFTKRVFLEVHALDAGSGRLLWAQRVDSEQSSTFAGGTMLVEQGQVIVSHRETLTAFDADSGEPQWSRVSEHGGGGLHSPLLQLVVEGARGRLLT